MQLVDSGTSTETYGDSSGLIGLRGQTLRALLAATAASTAGVLAVGAVDQPTRSTDLWIVVASLTLTAVATYKLRTLGLTPASLCLAAGLGLSLLIAIHLYPESQLVYLFALVAMASTVLLGIVYGSVVALLTSALILAMQANSPSIAWGETTGTLLAVIWGGVLLCWLATRPTRTALEWSWQSYVQALRKAEEARDRQGELGRLSKSLTEAYVRLEQINLELERARQAAEEARRLKTEFAAAISHELRTPLNLIIGFSEMMVVSPRSSYGKPLPETYRRDVGTIYQNACHISSLIDDILDLSQIDAHRMGLQRRRVSLAEVVEQAVASIAARFGVQGLSLRVDLPARLPDLYVDPTRIRQVLTNLLINAVRFTDEGGVTVSARCDEGEVVVSVSDTGVGIAPEDLPHVFEEFRQDSNWSRRRGGSGLGLTVSKRFVEMHGGSMWVASELGRGSTFYFSLPTCENVVTRPYSFEPVPAIPSKGRAADRTVVVLDADETVPRIFLRYLDGYNVVRAEDVGCALRTVRDRPVHAVVAGSPELRDAWHRLQLTHGGLSHLPVVTCQLQTTRSIARYLGVADYLTKPVTGDRLRAALRSIGGKRAIRSVVVADDDPEMVSLLVRMVRARNRRCQIWTAPSGAECLQLLRDKQPDVLILDLLMPEISGYDVLERMQSDEGLRDIPVLVITARAEQEETVIANTLALSRPGGLSVGEVMRCLRASLDALYDGAVGTGATPPAGSAA